MPRAGLTAAAVITAAAALADRDGFAAVTPAAVAREVGVRTPSLYAHVAGADALRSGVTALALDELADQVGDSVAGRSGSAALRSLADAYRAYARRHPGRYAATRRPIGVDETAAVAAAQRHRALVQAMLDGYDLAEGEQAHAVRVVGATVHGFVTLEATGGFEHSEPSADLSWDRAVEALDIALRHWPEPS